MLNLVCNSRCGIDFENVWEKVQRRLFASKREPEAPESILEEHRKILQMAKKDLQKHRPKLSSWLGNCKTNLRNHQKVERNWAYEETVGSRKLHYQWLHHLCPSSICNENKYESRFEYVARIEESKWNVCELSKDFTRRNHFCNLCIYRNILSRIPGFRD
jgi:hypothetical protein